MDGHHFGYITKLTPKKKTIGGITKRLYIKFLIVTPRYVFKNYTYTYVHTYIHIYTEFKIRIYHIRSWKPTGRVQVGTTTDGRRRNEGRRFDRWIARKKKKRRIWGFSKRSNWSRIHARNWEPCSVDFGADIARIRLKILT